MMSGASTQGNSWVVQVWRASPPGLVLEWWSNAAAIESSYTLRMLMPGFVSRVWETRQEVGGAVRSAACMAIAYKVGPAAAPFLSMLQGGAQHRMPQQQAQQHTPQTVNPPHIQYPTLQPSPMQTGPGGMGYVATDFKYPPYGMYPPHSAPACSPTPYIPIPPQTPQMIQPYVQKADPREPQLLPLPGTPGAGKMLNALTTLHAATQKQTIRHASDLPICVYTRS